MNKCLERVNGRFFWNPGVFSYATIPRCRPNSRFFFFIVASTVHDATYKVINAQALPWHNPPLPLCPGLMGLCRPPLTRISIFRDGHRVRSTEWRRSRNPSWPLITIPLSELLPASITFSNPRTIVDRSHLDLIDGFASKIKILLLCHGPVGIFRPHPQICAHMTTEVGALFDCSTSGEVGGGWRIGRRLGVFGGVAGDERKPRIVVESCGVRLIRTFFDYLSVGVRICPLYCIDFSRELPFKTANFLPLFFSSSFNHRTCIGYFLHSRPFSDNFKPYISFRSTVLVGVERFQMGTYMFFPLT
jgi:hypothetical protein